MREPKLHEEVFHIVEGKGIVTNVSGELFTVCFKDRGYLGFHMGLDRLDFFLRGDAVTIRKSKKKDPYTKAGCVGNPTEEVLGIYYFYAFMDHKPDSVSNFTVMNKSENISYAVTVNHVNEQAVHEYEEAKRKLERLRYEAHAMEKQVKWLEQRIDPVDSHFSEFDETSPNYFFKH